MSRREAAPIASLRTPDARFERLPDFAFAPHYLEDLAGFEGLRLHHLDEGPREAEQLFLCLHGQPTWSYLYRRMIPVFVHEAHGRVVAPDLYGFGRSDKPTEEACYTYAFHRETLRRFIERLDLRRITLVCQDWGGFLGLALVPEMPERFERLIVMNTAIPVGGSLGPGFIAWRDYCRSRPDLDVGRLLQRAVPTLTSEEAAAYDAPFPDARYKAGVRRFPELVPIAAGMAGAEEGRRALAFWSDAWRGESFMAIGMRDPVLPPPLMQDLHARIRGCPPPLEIADGGHFVQERAGERIARAALASFSPRTSAGRAS